MLNQNPENVEIFGAKVMGKRIDVISKTQVQVACGYIKAEYDTTENNFTILFAFDSTGIIHDSVISEIRKYWVEEEKWVKQYGVGKQYFEARSINAGFLTHDKTTYIPFIKTFDENDGAYFIICLDKNIYKVILTKGIGMGCLSSFLYQNLNLRKNNRNIVLIPTINKLETIKKLLD